MNKERFWSVKMLAENEATLTLYGEIRNSHPTDWWTGEKLEGCYITPKEFLEDIEKLKNVQKLTVRLNSVGGDAFIGKAIYSQLKTLQAHKTVIIDGIAASAASIIAMAGDEVKGSAGIQVMIHDAKAGTYNMLSVEELEKMKAMLESTNQAAAEIYANKTKLPIDEILAMMKAETWLTGREAKEKGFIDELLFEDDTDIKMSADKLSLIANGVSMSIEGYRNVPNFPVVTNLTGDNNLLNNKNNEGEENSMEFKTVEQLEKACPELVKQIKLEATNQGKQAGVTEERERLKGIDEISQMIPNELLQEAKFGEKACDAKTLAFQAMQLEQQKGNDFLKGLADDSKKSGVSQVTATPNGGTEPTQEELDKKAVNMILGGNKDE